MDTTKNNTNNTNNTNISSQEKKSNGIIKEPELFDNNENTELQSPQRTINNLDDETITREFPSPNQSDNTSPNSTTARVDNISTEINNIEEPIKELEEIKGEEKEESLPINESK